MYVLRRCVTVPPLTSWASETKQARNNKQTLLSHADVHLWLQKLPAAAWWRIIIYAAFVYCPHTRQGARSIERGNRLFWPELTDDRYP
jgi:hypothetical protein